MEWSHSKLGKKTLLGSTEGRKLLVSEVSASALWAGRHFVEYSQVSLRVSAYSTLWNTVGLAAESQLIAGFGIYFACRPFRG